MSAAGQIQPANPTRKRGVFNPFSKIKDPSLGHWVAVGSGSVRRSRPGLGFVEVGHQGWVDVIDRIEEVGYLPGSKSIVKSVISRSSPSRFGKTVRADSRIAMLRSSQ
jgi:hypothetical protein